MLFKNLNALIFIRLSVTTLGLTNEIECGSHSISFVKRDVFIDVFDDLGIKTFEKHQNRLFKLWTKPRTPFKLFSKKG